MNDTSDPARDGASIEEALVERLRAREQRAWGDLYDLHYARIWRYVYARTGDRDASDDLAAQVFTEALSAIRRYRYTGRPLLAWLYRIARNLAAAQARRRRREAAGSQAEPGGGSLEERLDSMELARALERLTGDQREVVALRFFAGYSTREIAAALSKSESAVYSLEVRAIGALRRLLDDGKSLMIEADEISPLTDIDTAI